MEFDFQALVDSGKISPIYCAGCPKDNNVKTNEEYWEPTSQGSNNPWSGRPAQGSKPIKDSGMLSISIFGIEGTEQVFTIGHFKKCPDCEKETNWMYHIAKYCDEDFKWFEITEAWTEASYPLAYCQ